VRHKDIISLQRQNILKLSLHDSQGETCLVNIVENWEEMEAYSGQVKNGYYQILGIDGIIELRVQLGRLGFMKEFKDCNDPLLTRIVSFCKGRQYFNVSKTVREDLFFK